MKVSLRQALIVLLFAVAAGLSAQQHQTQIPKSQTEGAGHAAQAEAYFESLHTVPPDFNWRLVNQAVREARYQKLSKPFESVLQDTFTVKGKWEEVGSSNQAGRVVAVDYDDATGRVWVAGAGGTIWRGNVQGTSWTVLNETRRISDPQLMKNIRLSNGKERLVVVSSGARSYYLDEGSAEWKQSTGLEEMQRWGSFRDAVVCSRNGVDELYALGDEWDYSTLWKARRVLYRSTDNGTSFSRLKWFDGLGEIWSDGYDNVILIHGDTLSFVSPQGALENSRVSQVWNGARRLSLAGAEISWLMLAVGRGDSTQFHETFDLGENWEYKSSLRFTPFNVRSFHQTQGNAQAWLFGAVDVFRSTDGGTAWNRVNSWGQYYGNPSKYLHADIPGFYSFMKADKKPLTFICTDGGLYTSTDEVATVSNISLSDLNVSQYYSSYTSRDNVNVIYAGSQDQGYQRTNETEIGPKGFRQMISGDYSSLVSGDQGHTVFCVYPGFVMYLPRAEDGWAPLTLDFTSKGQLWLPPLASLNSNPKHVLMGGGTNTRGAYLYLYAALSGELKATELPFDFGEGKSDIRITAVKTFESDDTYQYVVTSAGFVFFSNDKGLTWQKRQRPDGLREHYFSGNAIATDDKTASTLYLGGNGYDGPGVYASYNTGDTFVPLEGLPPCLVLGLAVGLNGRYIAAATDVGAFVYDTLSHQWTDVMLQGGPDQTYWHVDWIPQLKRFRFSTYGRGIFDFIPDAPPLVSVTEAERTMNRLVVRNVTDGGVSYAEILNAPGSTAQVKWYDVSGRELHSKTLQLESGRNIVQRPTQSTSILFVVITLENGAVGGCVVTP